MPRLSSNVEAGGYTPDSEPVTRKPRSRSIPASGAIAEPPIPIMCMCFGSVMTTPPVQEFPSRLLPWLTNEPSRPAAPLTWDASCGQRALQKQSERRAARVFFGTHRAPSDCLPPSPRTLENRPVQFRERSRISPPVSGASKRDPLATASFRDLPEQESHHRFLNPTAFRWPFPQESSTRRAPARELRRGTKLLPGGPVSNRYQCFVAPPATIFCRTRLAPRSRIPVPRPTSAIKM